MVKDYQKGTNCQAPNKSERSLRTWPYAYNEILDVLPVVLSVISIRGWVGSGVILNRFGTECSSAAPTIIPRSPWICFRSRGFSFLSFFTFIIGLYRRLHGCQSLYETWFVIFRQFFFPKPDLITNRPTGAFYEDRPVIKPTLFSLCSFFHNQIVSPFI